MIRETPMRELKVAPWPDFAGVPIREGDILVHPSGEKGVVVFQAERPEPSDHWRVDYGDGFSSSLALQIGDKGRAVVWRARKDPAGPAPSPLTQEERQQLAAVAVAASAEIEFCLAVIERLTGEKVVPADEKITLVPRRLFS